MAEPEFIRATQVKRTCWIEYNRPPVNAFNRQMVGEVRDAIAAASDDASVRVIILASAVESYFSAGADLNEFDGMRSEGMRAWVDTCHDIARKLRTSPKPVLAAIHGTAVGGGLEMALHCDVRFAASNARLGQPEINIAFIPPIAATQALTRLIGRPNTLRYLYSGRLIDVAEAHEWGLIDEITDPGELRTVVQEYADDLSEKSPAALAAIRRTVTLGGGMSYEDGMQLELDTAAELADTPDFAEGISAFLTKRKPVWRGS